MRYRQDADAEQLARARLAFVSEGHRSLTAPRHALEVVDEEEPEEIPVGPVSHGSWAQRVALTRTHLMALGIVLLVVAIALGFAWTRASAEVIPTAPVVESDPPVQEVATQAVEEPAPEPVDVRVHVLGSVVSPGVVTLPEGAIVADAVAAAGGFTDDAVPGDLNLAAAVSEGMQVKVGSADDDSHVQGAAPASGHGAAAGGGSAGDKVNLNTATQAQLEELPGVGPVMAGAILSWREQNGQFSSVSELQEISGVGPKTFAKLEPLVSV